MTRIPYLPLYQYASKPIEPRQLARDSRRYHRAVDTAASRWQAAGRVVRDDVLRGISMSQNNPLTDLLTTVLGQGTRHLARGLKSQEMPSSVVNAGVIGVIASSGVYGGAHMLEWAGMTLVGVASELSATVGLGLRYVGALVGAAVGLAVGAVHAVYRLATWASTTTLQQEKVGENAALSTMYRHYFGFTKSGWSPKWTEIAGTRVADQFDRDVLRSNHTCVSHNPAGVIPIVAEHLEASTIENIENMTFEEVEALSAQPSEPESELTRKTRVLRKLEKICENDPTWLAHLTCVLNQSLGNAVFDFLATNDILHQGNSAVRPSQGPTSQSHLVSPIDANRLQVSGTLRWKKGFPLMDAANNVVPDGASRPLTYEYGLTLQRPTNADDTLDVTLAWARFLPRYIVATHASGAPDRGDLKSTTLPAFEFPATPESITTPNAP